MAWRNIRFLAKGSEFWGQRAPRFDVGLRVFRTRGFELKGFYCVRLMSTRILKTQYFPGEVYYTRRGEVQGPNKQHTR